jgi:hypothetical protein
VCRVRKRRGHGKRRGQGLTMKPKLASASHVLGLQDVPPYLLFNMIFQGHDNLLKQKTLELPAHVKLLLWPYICKSGEAKVSLYS